MRYIRFIYWLNDDVRTAYEKVPDNTLDCMLNMSGEDYVTTLCEEYGIDPEEEEPEEYPEFMWEEISKEEYEDEIW